MIYGKLLNGDLSDMSYRQPHTWTDGSTDVPLLAMPTWIGPSGYDATNKLPVAAPTTESQLDTMGGRVLAALALKSSASWAKLNAAQQAKVQAVIDNAGTAIIAAITGS